MASEEPMEGAQIWLGAGLNGKNVDVRGRNCADGRKKIEALPLADLLLDPAGGFLTLKGARMPADTFTYRENGSDGRKSVIEMSTPDDFLVPVYRFEFVIVKEHGEWRWCGGEGA